jgi:hypothetical protein
LDLNFRAIYQGKEARHRYEFKSTIFAEEENSTRIPAHDEGESIQARYGYLKSLRRVGWQAGAGAALKLPDANRRLMLKSDLVQPDKDENLQRVFAEFSIAWTPNPALLWRLHLLPKGLFDWSGEQTMLYGQVADETYTGFGFRGEFAFRHLGLQDLDDGPAPENSP